MVASRSATVTPKAPGKSSAPDTAARKTESGSRETSGNRVVADLLRDLQINGKALSAQIERLRHRFP